MQVRALFLGSLVAGCAPLGQGIQIGQEAGCGHLTASTHLLEEVTPLGISAADFFEAHPSHTGTLLWADGGSTTVDLTLSYDGELASEDDDILYQTGDELSCPDRLLTNAMLTLQTQDGALDETLQGEILIEGLDSGSFSGDRTGDTLQGTLDLSRFVTIPSLRSALVYVLLDVTAAGYRGTIEVNPQDEQSDDEDGPLHDVATF